MNSIALDFFVGRDKDTYLYSSIGMTSFSGMGNLFVPILIAALIVLNTMLGAVYERVREISIYSSVGLAPVQYRLPLPRRGMRIRHRWCGIRLPYGTSHSHNPRAFRLARWADAQLLINVHRCCDDYRHGRRAVEYPVSSD